MSRGALGSPGSTAYESPELPGKIINVVNYGAVGDGVNDDTEAIQGAVTSNPQAIIHFPRGTYLLSSAIELEDDQVIQGEGMGATVLKQAGSNRLLNRTFKSPRSGFLVVRDLTLLGLWESNQSMGVDDDRHTSINSYERVLFDNVESRYSRQMGITVGYCDEVVVRNCRVRYCARDAINLSNCNRAIVTGNHIRGCYDDAVAIHNNTSSGNPPLEGHVVSGNVVEDSFGIKLLGAVRAKVTDNTLMRCKGYGVYTSDEDPEGVNDLMDLVVANNTITDTINANKFGGGSIRDAIRISSSSTSWVTGVQPTTPTITKPEDLSYLSNADAAQNAGGQRIVVANNVIATTLPAVAAYSTWGYGEAFTASGFTDPDLSTGFANSTIGLAVSGAVVGPLAVSGNVFERIETGVRLLSGADALENLVVSGNTFRRFATSGVTLDAGSAKYGRVIIQGNLFDGDPLFESGNRTSPLDGTWDSGQITPCAVWGVNYSTVSVVANTFRNVNRVLHRNSATTFSFAGNVYAFEPASGHSQAANSNSNKGIRTPEGSRSVDAVIMWEASDPTAANYGQVLSFTDDMSASSMPTSGYYVTGQTVWNRAITESGSSPDKYTIIGWQRLTTGNSHTLNTDWREMRALTGN